MATREVIESDLDGTLGATTRFFSVGDRGLMVDLTDEQWETLLLTPLDPIIRVARPATPPKPKVVPDTTKAERDAVREWARENGHEVAPRGRVPKAVTKAFAAAHPEKEIDLTPLG